MRIIFLACILFLIQVSSQDVKAEERDEGLSEMKKILLNLMDRMDAMEKIEHNVLNDTTIEERVTILEFQVSGLTEEVTDLGVEVTDLGDEIDVIDGEIAVILTGQVIQDERILELEADSEVYEDSIANLDEAVSAVDVTLTEVNFTLSGEIQDVDTGLAALGDTVTELEGRMENVESELASIEEIISELEGRLTKLEVAGTVAFEVDLDAYTSIPVNSYVIFDQIFLNIGDGYNSTTGTFTVPPGGDGLYFFYISFRVSNQERAIFRITKNGGGGVCRADTDFDNAGVNDGGMISCGTIELVVEGDFFQVNYFSGTDDTPVPSNTNNYNMFSGFRVAPM